MLPHEAKAINKLGDTVKALEGVVNILNDLSLTGDVRKEVRKALLQSTRLIASSELLLCKTIGAGERGAQ